MFPSERATLPASLQMLEFTVLVVLKLHVFNLTLAKHKTTGRSSRLHLSENLNNLNFKV